MSEHSDTESFKSATAEQLAEDSTGPKDGSQRFEPEEEAALLAESNTSKTHANSLFANASYSEAVQTYDKALASCPNYLDYELAVLRSNIAACHVKLSDWKAAVDAASQGLDCLERLDPMPKEASKIAADGRGQQPSDSSSPAVAEEVDDATEERINALESSGHTRAEVQRIRIKALMRRAKARMEIGGWAALEEANKDYRTLSKMAELSNLDRKAVDTALRSLPPRLEAAKQQEMAEMMGKLKGLGNGILKPFGLSTDNFQFTKDEKSGGYSMNFNQDGGGKK
ncbi:MAG: hypothetical protein M1828_004643 [Chrysothrix sp. TS-e1954]|nr:MAG: hypothetical protein M1828_004643 [Chrysothrix sp. TS-e1954]